MSEILMLHFHRLLVENSSSIVPAKWLAEQNRKTWLLNCVVMFVIK